MNRTTIFAGICLAVIIPFLCFSYLLRTTRSIPAQIFKIDLVVDGKAQEVGRINPDSLRLLEKSITESIIVKDQAKLIETFEKERGKYIELLTTISVILAIFGLYTFATIFIDKNEVSRLQKEMQETITDYNLELSKIKLNQKFEAFSSHTKLLKERVRLLIEDNSPISDFEQYKKFSFQKFASFIREIEEKELSNISTLRRFCVLVTNYMINSRNYANTQFNSNIINYSVSNNELLADVIKQLCHKFPTLYPQIKDTIIQIDNPKIEWGVY